MNAKLVAGTGRRLTRFGEPVQFAEGLYRLKTRTHAWMVPNGSWGESNCGLIDCDGQSVLVDTCWDVRLTQEVLDTSADLVGRSPIELLINTHADGDHCWGNQLLENKEIIASLASVRQMKHHPPGLLRSLARAGRLLRFLPIGGIDQWGHYLHQMFRPYEFGNIAVTLPSKAFSGQERLDVNGTEIIVTEVGPGHTDGDSIVHVPDERVVYAGDILFVGVTPVIWAGPVDRVVAALRRILALEPDVIVPGHGPLAAPSDVQRLIGYWDFVQEGLFKRFRLGMSALDAARDLLLSPEFRAAGFLQWDSPERLATSACTIYRAWGAGPDKPPGRLGLLNLLRRQAMLGFLLPDASPRVMHRR